MTSKEQISALSRVDIHTNLLAVNVTQVESVLESHPWIARAKVVRDWPNRLLVNLQEKNPVALLNRESGLFYLDSRGGIIAAVNPSQELDFPVITGLEKFVITSYSIHYTKLYEVHSMLFSSLLQCRKQSFF